jgi:hypothetical protein
MIALQHTISAKKPYWTSKRIVFLVLIIYVFALSIALPIALIKMLL